MKKRVLSLCLFAIMAVSMMAGCSSKQEETNKTGQESQSDTEKNQKLNYEEIVVGLDDTFAPMGFRDEDGELTGLDVELAKAVSEELGIPFKLQPIDWSMKETELINKNIDLIWNGYSITSERKEKVLFTNPYLKNKQIVVTMADSDINKLSDLAGKVVAIQAESSAVDAVNTKPEIKDSFQEVALFETNNDCLMDLEAGRSNAVVADEVLIRYYISQKGEEKYKILDEDFGQEEYGIGARKDDQALIDAVNGAISTLKENGKAAEISTKWFGSDIIE